jgi:hypothetical protein
MDINKKIAIPILVIMGIGSILASYYQRNDTMSTEQFTEAGYGSGSKLVQAFTVSQSYSFESSLSKNFSYQ